MLLATSEASSAVIAQGIAFASAVVIGLVGPWVASHAKRRPDGGSENESENDELAEHGRTLKAHGRRITALEEAE